MGNDTKIRIRLFNNDCFLSLSHLQEAMEDVPINQSWNDLFIVPTVMQRLSSIWMIMMYY